MAKLEKMIRFLPGLYRPETNITNRGLLYAWSDEDDRVVTAIEDAKEQIFVSLAQIQFLDALGSNVGVFRPTAFNLADSLYRRLIPALSYHPKQVKPTIVEVLGIFFGDNNPIVEVSELNPNEIVIQIPSAVPALRRSLRGSHHFHNYSGNIISIDNFSKEIVIDLDGDTKVLKESELANGRLGQGLNTIGIIDNTAGATGVTVQFDAGSDLSVLNTTDKFIFLVNKYPGSYLPDPTRPYSVRSRRGVLGETISEGLIHPTITMLDSSDLPNEEGFLIFNLSKPNEESMIKYVGRPNNTTLLIDPTYVFQQEHLSGEPVNLIQVPSNEVRVNGFDYSVYIVGVEAARILAQRIVESLVAAGVVIRWIVVEPVC